MVFSENYLHTTTTLKCTYLLFLLSLFFVCTFSLLNVRPVFFLFLSFFSPEFLSLSLFFSFSVITSSSIYFLILPFTQTTAYSQSFSILFPSKYNYTILLFVVYHVSLYSSFLVLHAFLSLLSFFFCILLSCVFFYPFWFCFILSIFYFSSHTSTESFFISDSVFGRGCIFIFIFPFTLLSLLLLSFFPYYFSTFFFLSIPFL